MDSLSGNKHNTHNNNNNTMQTKQQHNNKFQNSQKKKKLNLILQTNSGRHTILAKRRHQSDLRLGHFVVGRSHSGIIIIIIIIVIVVVVVVHVLIATLF
jgi:hypothetical protein